MKNLRSLLIGLMSLLFVLQIGLVSQASAQDYNRQSERERLAAVMNPNANPEEFRTEMVNYLTEMENALQKFEKFPAVSRQFDKDGLDPIAALRSAKANLAEIPVEDLVKMRTTYAKFSGWREAPRALDAIVERLEKNRKKDKDSGVDTTNVITPDACPDISGTPSFADIAITEGFFIVGDNLMEAFPTDGLTILARLIPIAARAVLQAALLAENTLRSQYDDCHGLGASDVQTIVDGAKTEIINNDNANTTTIVNNDDSNKTMLTTTVTNAKTDIINNDNNNKTMLTTTIANAQTSINNTTNASSTAITTAITNAQTAIVNNDNSNKTMIVNNDNSNAATLNTNLTNAKNMIITNDNTNTTNIVNNDNSNKTMIVNNANANATALTNLMLRTQIEADLAEADNATFVGLYVTPTANGGYLDLVRFIVVDTIAKLAGASTAQANALLAQADAFKTAGNYKSAYQYYRKAYKAAVN